MRASSAVREGPSRWEIPGVPQLGRECHLRLLRTAVGDHKSLGSVSSEAGNRGRPPSDRERLLIGPSSRGGLQRQLRCACAQEPAPAPRMFMWRHRQPRLFSLYSRTFPSPNFTKRRKQGSNIALSLLPQLCCRRYQTPHGIPLVNPSMSSDTPRYLGYSTVETPVRNARVRLLHPDDPRNIQPAQFVGGSASALDDVTETRKEALASPPPLGCRLL